MDKEREKIREEIFGKPKEAEQKQPGEVERPDVNPGLLRMFPPDRLKKTMEKEARKYKQALEKKWSRWFESVSK